MPRLRRIGFVVAVMAGFLFLLYNLVYYTKFFPNTIVSGVNVSGMSIIEANLALTQSVNPPQKLVLTAGGENYEIDTEELGVSYQYDSSLKRIFRLFRTGNIFFDFSRRFLSLVKPNEYGLDVNLDREALASFISEVNQEVSVDPIYPSAKIVNGVVLINSGKAGNKINSQLLEALVDKSLSLADKNPITIPLTLIDPTLSDTKAKDYQNRAEKLLGKKLILTFEYDSFVFDQSDLIDVLDPNEGLSPDILQENIYNIAQKINRDPQEPKFTFENGKVIEFLPAKDGIELDSDNFEQKLTDLIAQLSDSEESTLTSEVPVFETAPKITTDKVNDLGIKELIGRGTSRFRGSIPSRIHNVQLASSRLNGILIKPGEVFSFNDALGDVSKFTGYQEAYVIREGKTILGDGGGVCQVSTTFFRAALDAGLPILERQAHAYRVGYYEQDSLPGLDATVYGPSPDLKIKNDTPASILIQATADTKNLSLVFEFYGTNDGRVSTVSKPLVTSVIPAGEDQYVDDPTLPLGTVKQTEHKANGAKVVFNYSVERGGEIIYKKTFTSNYRPWPAVYLRGTGPVQ